MTINVMQGALAAALMQSAKQPPNKVLSIAALAALTPGILGLALPLAVLGARKAAPAEPAQPAPVPVPLVQVPDLSGNDEATATQRLKDAGLLATVHVRAVKGIDGVPGEVIAQAPPAGVAVEPGSSVVLYLQPEPEPIGGCADEI